MQQRIPAALALLLAGCGGGSRDDTTRSAGRLEAERPREVLAPDPPTVRVPPRSAVAAPAPDRTPVEPIDDRAAFRVELTAIYATLRRSCGECHGGAREPGPRTRMEFSDNWAWMVERGFVWPLDGAGSPLVVMMTDGSMPPPGLEPRPTAEEIEAIVRFIDNVGNWSTLPPDPALYGFGGFFLLEDPMPQPADAGPDGG